MIYSKISVNIIVSGSLEKVGALAGFLDPNNIIRAAGLPIPPTGEVWGESRKLIELSKSHSNEDKKIFTRHELPLTNRLPRVGHPS